LPAFGLVRIRTLPAASSRPSGARHFERAVAGAVVDHNHPQVRIIGVERGPHRALDHFLFVVGGDEHRDFGLIRCDLGGFSEDLFRKAVVDGCRTDEQQAPRHEQIAEEENPGDAHYGRVEEPEAQPIQQCGPALAGGQGRHDVGPGFAE